MNHLHRQQIRAFGGEKAIRFHGIDAKPSNEEKTVSYADIVAGMEEVITGGEIDVSLSDNEDVNSNDSFARDYEVVIV